MMSAYSTFVKFAGLVMFFFVTGSLGILKSQQEEVDTLYETALHEYHAQDAEYEKQKDFWEEIVDHPETITPAKYTNYRDLARRQATACVMQIDPAHQYTCVIHETWVSGGTSGSLDVWGTDITIYDTTVFGKDGQVLNPKFIQMIDSVQTHGIESVLHKPGPKPQPDDPRFAHYDVFEQALINGNLLLIWTALSGLVLCLFHIGISEHMAREIKWLNVGDNSTLLMRTIAYLLCLPVFGTIFALYIPSYGIVRTGQLIASVLQKIFTVPMSAWQNFHDRRHHYTEHIRQLKAAIKSLKAARAIAVRHGKPTDAIDARIQECKESISRVRETSPGPSPEELEDRATQAAINAALDSASAALGDAKARIDADTTTRQNLEKIEKALSS